MSHITSQEIRLTQRPVGLPKPDDFEVATVSLPEPGSGEILVRNRFISVDPYMRGRMVDRKSYTPPFQLGEALTGGCVGEVIQSNHEGFTEGDHVLGMLGWREAYLSDGKGLQKIDPSLAPLQSFLGTMGMPGMTAYFGLLEIGKPQAGETVFVSAAAGAVGSIVCQIAKIKGCRVVGSAGTAAKIAWLEEIGVDVAINYKDVDNLTHVLGQACPDGLDIYFENVGGEHLQAALAIANNQARIPFCGMIAQYNATEPVPGPNNLGNIIGKRLLLQGFIVSDFMADSNRFYQEMGQWIQEGKITWQETIVDGVENTPQAFIGLFSGENLGKMVVKV
ncbi:MAG: NADP-dependent oxidoreductase [Chloroflexota bacterium]